MATYKYFDASVCSASILSPPKGLIFDLFVVDPIKKTSPRIAAFLEAEKRRQNGTIDLIPSENIASLSVREALASFFVNKYAEGYPGKRYYPGNAIADSLERFVQRRALKLFRLSSRAWHINAQPYSGSPANLAVYTALLEFGDSLMGLALNQGGHLTHGHSVNFSGKAYRAIPYRLSSNGRIDYEHLARTARAKKPKLIISGATAYPRRIDFKKIGEIAKRAHAYHMADISHIAGLVAARVHPSPFPWADVVTTTTHKTLRGPRGALIFCREAFAAAIDRAVFPGLQGGPHLHTIAAIGVALEEASRPSFVAYQRSIVVNARAFADAMRDHGFTLVSGGTDTHLLLIDLRTKGISGAKAEQLLERAGIIANRNTVPGDLTPFAPSGIRFGTPSVTSRGMGPRQMQIIADLIHELIDGAAPPRRIAPAVKRLCRQFPIP